MTVFSSLSLFIRGAHYVMDFDSWFSKAKFLNSNDETQSDFLIRPTWTGQSNLTNCLNTGYPYSWWLPILFQNDSFILCSLKGNFPSAAGSKSYFWRKIFVPFGPPYRHRTWKQQTSSLSYSMSTQIPIIFSNGTPASVSDVFAFLQTLRKSLFKGFSRTLHTYD